MERENFELERLNIFTKLQHQEQLLQVLTLLLKEHLR